MNKAHRASPVYRHFVKNILGKKRRVIYVRGFNLVTLPSHYIY